MGNKTKKAPNGIKANVFKVAGARSLKKTKSKAVNLGLKNIKASVAEIDKQFLDLSKKSKCNVSEAIKIKSTVKSDNKEKLVVNRQDISDAVQKIEKMDL